MNIIDRRRNPGGKSLENRQRFLRRAKAFVRDAVRESSKDRSIKDFEQGGEVAIPVRGVSEPRLTHASSGGRRESVLSGNKKYVAGDTISKDQAGGSGSGWEGSPDGAGEDDFRFVLTQAEYLDLFLEDLELPDLAKRRLATNESLSLQRAGYSVSGSPASLALGRTMRNSLSRRFALRRPAPEAIKQLEREIDALAGENGDEGRLQALRRELNQLVSRVRRIPFMDPIDIRYRRYQAMPKPIAQAVMFCLMDTSASMTEDMKDLAKSFFALLYIFLKRRYRHVEIVFIRHTDHAAEVDEDTFFHSRETGGTIVSSALEEMIRVVDARYRIDDWNIYAAQASDGDNTSSDTDRTTGLLETGVLPLCQYFAYIEVGRDRGVVGFMSRTTELWRGYATVVAADARFAMCRVGDRADIYPVFRRLFERRTNVEGCEPV